MFHLWLAEIDPEAVFHSVSAFQSHTTLNNRGYGLLTQLMQHSALPRQVYPIGVIPVCAWLAEKLTSE